MKDNAVALVCILIFCVCCVVECNYKLKKRYLNCIYDKKVDWNEPSNYLNCTLEEQNIRDNKLDCCNKTNNNGIKCCDPDDKYQGNPDVIWAGIGVTGGILMIATFVYNWCDPQTFPCLKRYEKQINAQKKFWNSVLSCQCLKNQDDHEGSHITQITQCGYIAEDDTRMSQFAEGDSHVVEFYQNTTYA